MKCCISKWRWPVSTTDLKAFTLHIHYEVMIIKKWLMKNNIGDTNKLYVTLHEMDCLLLENCQMGGEGRKLLEDKEWKTRKREIENIWLAGAMWSSLFGVRRPELVWSLETGQLNILHFWSSPLTTAQKSSEFLCWSDTLARSAFIGGLEIYFNSNYVFIKTHYIFLLK